MKKLEIGNWKNVAGFTLVETLTALFILALGILGALATITFSLNSALVVEDNLVASNLVQEGIEVVRNLRDRDWLAGNSFGAFISGGGPDFRVQWDSTTLLPFNGNPTLRQNTSTGLFSYDASSAATDTKFKRQLTITKLSNIELKIVSTVSWSNRGVNKQVSAEEHLFDWR